MDTPTAAPRVSVIMGVYNPPKRLLLSRSVDSILEQSFANFEFIIYNDGSRPEVSEWLQEIKSSDPRVVVIESDANHGLAYGLNRCIEAAQGDYIARMDDDDIAESDRFKTQVEFLDAHPEYAMVGSTLSLFNDDGVYGSRGAPAEPSTWDLAKGGCIHHPTIMIRSGVLRKLGGYSQESYVLRCEDYELWFRFHAAGHRMRNLQEPVLKYREDSAAMRKRLWKYRLNEATVRFKGVRMCRMPVTTYPLVLKPLLVGLIPRRAMLAYKQRKASKGA